MKKAEKSSSGKRVLSLELNNSDLASLVGPMDANLTQIETALDVDISRKGTRFETKKQSLLPKISSCTLWGNQRRYLLVKLKNQCRN